LNQKRNRVKNIKIQKNGKRDKNQQTKRYTESYILIDSPQAGLSKDIEKTVEEQTPGK
jgi:tRNA/tmRNA/rRNA uracil-C5-methylase (TrmA/RlmC/RlmD family)